MIVDTDLGADDVMALLFLLQSPGIDVRAVTIAGTGLVHCEPGVRHVNGLLEMTGAAGIPVACGRETPLQGERAFPAALRAEADRLYGVPLSGGPGDESSLGAVGLMASVLEASPDPMTLLSLGPPTNVAELLQTKPEALVKIDLIYASGGALDGGTSDQREPVEWNFYVDPQAARHVLDSGALVTLVTLEAADDVTVTPEFAGMLGDPASTPAADVIATLIAGNPALSGPDFLLWDLLTAAVSSDQALAVYEMDRVALAGATGEESGVITTDVADGARVRVAISAVRDRFDAVIAAALAPSAGSIDGDVDATDAAVASGEIVWEFGLQGEYDGVVEGQHSRAAIDDGVVYFGGSNGTVYALDVETGREIWALPMSDGTAISDFIALSDRNVFFKTLIEPDSFGAGTPLEPPVEAVFAVDRQSGQESWRFTLSEGESGTPPRNPVFADGVVYTGTTEFFYALDGDTGAELWRFRPEGGAPGPAAPATVVDGVAYFGTPASLLYAVDIETHEELWSFQAGPGQNGVASKPAVVDGVVYFGGDDAVFYAVDAANGKEIWRFAAPGALPSSPAVSAGQVMFGVISGGDSRLVALDQATGAEVWGATSGAIISSPAVEGGVVYVGSSDGNLYAVDVESGDVLWRFQTENPIGSSPVVADGVAYFLVGLTFYAVGAPS